MVKRDDPLDYEEAFFSSGKRESRKERRISQCKDRSKYKKSDQDQRKHQSSQEEPPVAEGLKRGRILRIAPEIITVATDHQIYLCTLKGSLKKEKTKQKNLTAVGDWVHFEPKTPEEGTITRVEKRTSLLARCDNLSRRKQQLIAVNIDQVFIVMSVVAPKFKPLLIDRYLISARKGNMEPLILINKIDLLKNPPKHIPLSEVEEERKLLETFEQGYSSLNLSILLLSCHTGENIDQLKKHMQNKTSVFSGQSGGGKSSLINATLGTDLRVGKVVEKTRKGSHTTTGAALIPLEGEGFCIDTPGIKSFGIWDLSKQEIAENFSEFYPLALSCQFPNCTHLHEPNCAVKKALEEGKISPLRYASYTALTKSESPKDWE